MLNISGSDADPLRIPFYRKSLNIVGAPYRMAVSLRMGFLRLFTACEYPLFDSFIIYLFFLHKRESFINSRGFLVADCPTRRALTQPYLCPLPASFSVIPSQKILYIFKR